MGARWSWSAVCPNGHFYGNFSGGADDCYTCNTSPIMEVEDEYTEAAEVQARLWRALADHRSRVLHNQCTLCGQDLPKE